MSRKKSQRSYKLSIGRKKGSNQGRTDETMTFSYNATSPQTTNGSADRVFYPVESSTVSTVIQLLITFFVTSFVLYQNFRIINLIRRTKKLWTPAHYLVTVLLSFDSLMLSHFTFLVFFILLNRGIWLNTIECKFMYFTLRLFRGVQITNFTVVSLEKALFIISPYRYEVIFDTKIPLIIVVTIYTISGLVSISSFNENVEFSVGALTCTSSVFESNDPYLTVGIVVRALLFFICLVCLVSVTSFAVYFYIKETRAIRRMTQSIERDFFYAMVRNIVINSIITFSWSLQWALIAMTNASQDNVIKGRTAVILYHCFVATVNPIMVRFCYKPIREGLKRCAVSPLQTEFDEKIMGEEMSIETFLYDKKNHGPRTDGCDGKLDTIDVDETKDHTSSRAVVAHGGTENALQDLKIYVIGNTIDDRLNTNNLFNGANTL